MENQTPMGHPNKLIQELIGDRLSSMIRSHVEKIVDLVEDFEGSMPPSVYRSGVSWVFAWVKPFLRASGFRIRLISESSIEAILPFRSPTVSKGADKIEPIDEGLLLSGAVFCFRSLIKRNFPNPNVSIDVKRLEVSIHKSLFCDLYFVCEFPALKRELIYAQAAKDAPVDLQVTVAIKDKFGVLLSDVQINAQAIVNPTLEWKQP